MEEKKVDKNGEYRKVLAFAKEFGFTEVWDTEKEWNGYRVWDVGYKEGPCCIGFVRFILVKGEDMHMTDAEEGAKVENDIFATEDDDEDLIVE